MRKIININLLLFSVLLVPNTILAEGKDVISSSSISSSLLEDSKEKIDEDVKGEEPRILTDEDSYLDVKRTIKGNDYYPVKNEEDIDYQMNLGRSIYLLNDISVVNGHEVFDGFSIYGEDDSNIKHELYLYTNNSTKYGFYTTSGSSIDVSLYNIRIKSDRSYYGIIYYPDSTEGKQYFENVDYYSDNSQPFYCESAEIHIKDSNFIQRNGGGSAQEFMESRKLVLEGNVNIEHDSTGGANSNAFMWWRSIKGGENYIRVLDNSNVSITTGKTFIYSSTVPDVFNIDVGNYSTLNLSLGSNYSNTNLNIPNNYNLGIGATLNIKDITKEYGRSGSSYFLPLYSSGMFNLNKDSNLKIISDNTNNLVYQVGYSNNKPFNIPQDIGSVVLENNNKKGGFLLLNSYDSSYLKTNNTKVIFSDNNGFYDDDIIGDYSKIKLNRSKPSILETNNNYTKYSFSDLYLKSNKIEFTKTNSIDYRLEYDKIYSSNLILTGKVVKGATVWINYYNKKGELKEDIYESSNGMYSFDLKDKVDINKEIVISANIGGKDIDAGVSKSVNIIDDVKPVGIPKLNKININDLENYNYRDLFESITDDSGKEVSINVKKKFDNNLGYQESIVELEDFSGNKETYHIYAFIYDDESYIDEDIFVTKNYFEVYDYETSDVKELLNRLNYRVLNSKGEDITDTKELVSTNLEELSSEGVYEAKYRLSNGKEYKINIKVKTTTELVDVDLPNKITFGTLDIFEGNIISPNYTVKNNSSIDTKIYLSSIDYLNKDSIDLKNKLDLNINDVKIEDDKLLFILKPNQEDKFSLSGIYRGSFEKVIKPKYNFNIRIE